MAGIGGSRLGWVGHSHFRTGSKPPSVHRPRRCAQHHQGTTGLVRRGLLRKRLRTSAHQNLCNSATQQLLHRQTWWLDPWCLRQSQRSSLRPSRHCTPSRRQIRLTRSDAVSHGRIGSSVQRIRLRPRVLLCSDGSAFRMPWIPHPSLQWKSRHLCRLPSNCEIPNAPRVIFALLRHAWCRVHLHPFPQSSFPRLVTLVQGLANSEAHHGVIPWATTGLQSCTSEVRLWRSCLNARRREVHQEFERQQKGKDRSESRRMSVEKRKSRPQSNLHKMQPTYTKKQGSFAQIVLLAFVRSSCVLKLVANMGTAKPEKISEFERHCLNVALAQVA